MKNHYFIPICFALALSLSLFAQVKRPSLLDISNKINGELPEIYDQLTKLIRTSVENNNLRYHFVVNLNQTEYANTVAKVKAQVLGSVCKSSREKSILHQYRANLIYSYENIQGQELGEFMIRPEHCRKP